MFLSLAIDMLQGMEHNFSSYRYKQHVFKLLFGLDPRLAHFLWERLVDGNFFSHLPGVQERHLLWALLLLFTYPSEAVACVIVKVSRKTYRKWAWLVIKDISLLLPKVVRMKKILLIVHFKL